MHIFSESTVFGHALGFSCLSGHRLVTFVERMRRGVKRPPDTENGSDPESITSRTIQLPLPEDLDADGEVFVENSSLFERDSPAQWDEYSVPSRADHVTSDDSNAVLNDADRRKLKSMIDDACLSVKPTFKFQMPWERKGLAKIFNRDPAKLIPVPVMTPIEFSERESQSSSAVPHHLGRTIRGVYSEVINFDTTLTEREVEEAAMTRALEKWYLIFSSGREAWPRGFDLSAAIREHRLTDMQILFGNRSHGTVLRRGTSILQFVKWYRSRYFGMCPFPLSTEIVEEFVLQMVSENKPAGMDVDGGQPDLVSAKVRRLIEMQDSIRKEKVQARVLTVQEVEFLEMLISDERADITDRVACGCMLFCLYSRSRWSDIRKIYNFVSDVTEDEGKISGYLECRTRSHKTARLVAKGGISMPLVAPVWGITSPPWGLSFLKVCKLAHRDVCQLDHEPLLAAPTASGGWSCRAVTTKEAGKWIRNLLSQMECGANFTTIHTLKGTPLSWCAKWGLDPDCRAILGHHATGRSSVECYSRDNLAKPLREFELVLQQIRTKAFSPDSTRSGMIKGSSVEDPKSTFSVPAREESDREVSSDSSSSSTDADKSDASEPDEAEGHDPVAAPKTWDPDYDMYRNVKSKIVHITAHGGAEIFSCGVKITSDYEFIHSSQFLDLRKCKRCATSKPIRTVGQMASGLKKWRLAPTEEKRGGAF